METRALRPGDARNGFESGNPEIDDFFRNYAGQNQWRHHIGVTYCLLQGSRIAGFVTLSAGDVHPRELPSDVSSSLPRYGAPVLRLSRIGVSRSLQRTGLGRELLYSTAGIALEMRARVGCVGIVVDAKPDATGFYEHHGFRRLSVTSRTAGAGAPPVRLFCDIRYLLTGVTSARSGVTPADALATEIRRRTREMGLAPDEVRAAVDRLLDKDARVTR